MNPYEMTIGVLGGLALFLFGMRVMSEGLQKVAGDRMRQILGVMTSNRFAGVGTGVTVTCAIQSSSATTVMLVGFVSAGLLTLEQSVGVVMGANIGTTITGWLVAIVGFKIKISVMALPCIAVGFFARFTGNRKVVDWGEVLLGFGVLFLGLEFMKDAVTTLKEAPAIMEWMASTSASSLTSRFGAVIVGAVVTMVVQSSSATMAIAMTLAAEGIIDIHTACALVLGDNIGTTITANLAAIGTSATAKRTARVHLLFNLLGATWGVLLFVPFMSLVEYFVPGALEPGASKLVLATYVAAYHSAFNVTNTLLFLPFTNQLAWLSKRLVHSSEVPEEPILRFLDVKLMDSAPMALHAARNELLHMIQTVETMLSHVINLLQHPGEKLGEIAEEVHRLETKTDMLEREITRYLVQIVRLDTSSEQSTEIAGILNAVNDVERMGDHCESITKLARKRSLRRQGPLRDSGVGPAGKGLSGPPAFEPPQTIAHRSGRGTSHRELHQRHEKAGSQGPHQASEHRELRCGSGTDLHRHAHQPGEDRRPLLQRGRGPRR